MERKDIIGLLTRILGPIKMQPQQQAANFDKFQDILKQSLTQPSFDTRRTGVQFPDYQSYRLPEKIIEELDTMADEIVAALPNRNANDPVFWLRQRNLSVTAGFEENPENFLSLNFFRPFYQ